MNKTIFTETYKVRSTQVNLNNQLGLYGVLGMLQDIAAEHAFSHSDIAPLGCSRLPCGNLHHTIN